MTKLKKTKKLHNKLFSDLYKKLREKLEKVPKSVKVKGRNIPTLIIILLVLALILAIGAAVLKISDMSGGELLITFNGDGICVTDNRVTDIMLSTGKVSVHEDKCLTMAFQTESKLVRNGDDYKLVSGNQKFRLNVDYPVFLNNGAYVYLFNDNFLLIDKNFKSFSSEENTFIGSGAVFDKELKKKGSDDILLLQLKNNLYVNTQEIKVDTQGKVDVIEANTILKLDDTGITCCDLWDKEPALRFISTTQDLTMVNFKNKAVTYDNLFGKLKGNDAGKDGEGAKSEAIDEYRISEDIYQYFMGNKYDYRGEKVFYRSKDGFLMQNGGEKFLVFSMPFYFADEHKILLPTDYAVIEPKEFSMTKQPAMSEIYSDKNAIYARLGDKIQTYTDMFMFDGNDSYIFFSSAELSIGDTKISVTPFTSVTAGNDGIVEVYNYDKDEHKTFEAQGYKNIYISLMDGIKVNLGTDTLYQQGGKKQILFAKPSELKEAE